EARGPPHPDPEAYRRLHWRCSRASRCATMCPGGSDVPMSCAGGAVVAAAAAAVQSLCSVVRWWRRRLCARSAKTNGTGRWALDGGAATLA
uniref:4Fe-4S ferredoxin-type domain-containing protein n=1 Tax=Globodera pallida TaxID=36090 RepID=A0A183CNS7_GLOPA